MAKEKKVVATAAQIRRALKKVTPGMAGRAIGYLLLDVLREDGVKFSGRSIFEDARDWEAYFVVRRYCEASKELKARRPGKRIKDAARFNDAGYIAETKAA